MPADCLKAKACEKLKAGERLWTSLQNFKFEAFLNFFSKKRKQARERDVPNVKSTWR